MADGEVVWKEHHACGIGVSEANRAVVGECHGDRQ
jgi:hypothetical protein